jgi:hypothetical protein
VDALLGSIRGRNQAPAEVAAPKESVPCGGTTREEVLPARSTSQPTNFGPENSWKAFLSRPHAEDDATLVKSAL